MANRSSARRALRERYERLEARYPHLSTLAVAAVYLAGVMWRYLHITRFHDPRKYVYSDMKMYVDLGKRFAQPGYELHVADVTHPPGTALLIAHFFERDPDLSSLVMFQFAVSALVPLSVGAFAYVAFDKTAAKAAIVIASFYFPFIDFGGYFLSEIYMMALVPACLAAYLAAVKAPRVGRAAAWGVVAGLLLFAAMSLKMVALPAIVGFALLHWLVASAPPRRVRTVALAAMLVAAAPGTAAISQRCTQANEGEFCLGSNKSGADFLLGHYGRIQGLKWVDPERGTVFSFGSPSAYQHGYREIPEMPFGITDGDKNSDKAWEWIAGNKMKALVLSFEHVFDMFGATLPWPSVATGYWVGAQGTQYLFIVFLLIPSFVRLLDIARFEGLGALLRSRQLTVFSPILGVAAAVFIATGEPRYRMPFDAVFILLAIDFYRNFRPKRRRRSTA